MISDIANQLDRLEKEIVEVYEKLVLPTWGKEMHGFPQTLYGYMMEVFSFIDLLSAHWKGDENDQTKRMIEFMNKYIRDASEENSVLVQIWRHKLMHTARPRALKMRKQIRNTIGCCNGITTYQKTTITVSMKPQIEKY